MSHPPQIQPDSSGVEPGARGEVTRVLQALRNHAVNADEELLRLVYAELHRLASALVRGESADATLQATALLNEAYLRLLGREVQANWQNRAHFFTSSAEVMRRILIDAARRRRAEKRGGARKRVELRDTPGVEGHDPDVLLAVDEALKELAATDPHKAAIVNLRFFGGLTAEETAASLGVPLRTLEREWRYVKAWLVARLSAE